MECCLVNHYREAPVYRSNLMETMHVNSFAVRPDVEELADGAVEVFARDGVILVVIHSGRYQITIEVG